MTRLLHKAVIKLPEHPAEAHAARQKQRQRICAVRTVYLQYIPAALLGNLFRRARKLRKNTCVLQNAPPVLRSCQRAEREIIHKHCDLLLSPSYASARPFDTDRARSRSFCILCIFLQKVFVKT